MFVFCKSFPLYLHIHGGMSMYSGNKKNLKKTKQTYNGCPIGGVGILNFQFGVGVRPKGLQMGLKEWVGTKIGA